MRNIILGLILSSMFLPIVAYAVTCDVKNYTVVYTNGILTKRDAAENDAKALQDAIGYRLGDETVTVKVGYNESHIGGFGDTLQSIAQSFGTSVTDFDRDTILIQIHPQVSTRKILLLGHSQGTFYTNSIYKYLTENGVPEKSIAVYNLATPADRVEGGGQYLTSTNDKLINSIRPLMLKVGANAPLLANITIPLPENELNEKTGGHHFGSSYLAMEPERIVGDVSQALGKLKADSSLATEGCFTPPPSTLAHKAKSVAFAVADPVVEAVKDGDIAVVNAIGFAADATGRALGVGIIVTGRAIVYTAVVVGRAVVYAADVTARALIAAAEKAAAAASYAAAQARNIFSAATRASGNVSAASQVAAISPAMLNLSSPPAIAPAKATSPIVSVASVPAKTVATAPQITPKAPNTPAIPPPTQPPIQPPTPPPVLIPQALGPALVSVIPGFGGGGGGGSAAPSPSPVVEVPAPAVFVPLSIQAPMEGALFATSSVAFSGTTTPGYAVVASRDGVSVAASADANGDWSITLSLPEGSSSIGVVAADSVGNTSDAVARTVNVDTTPPGAPSASISECSASLSEQFCFIPATNATLVWSSVAGTAYYAYALGGAIAATTTQTTAAVSLAAGATSTFSVAAYDAAGNAATSTAVNVYVETQPLIINEIAWAGTQAEASDQWIEIKNISPYEIDNLSFIAVAAADGAPYIQLHINIIEGTTYIIERRTQATNATGDLITPFTELSQTGEELSLKWGSGSATTTLDSTPAVSVCGGWCAGDAESPRTMERKAGGTDGTVVASWQTGENTDASATDASGNAIEGTPRAENSAGWVPDEIFGIM